MGHKLRIAPIYQNIIKHFSLRLLYFFTPSIKTDLMSFKLSKYTFFKKVCFLRYHREETPKALKKELPIPQLMS